MRERHWGGWERVITPSGVGHQRHGHKTSVTCFTPIGMSNPKDVMTSVGEDVEKGESSPAAAGDIKRVAALEDPSAVSQGQAQ